MLQSTSYTAKYKPYVLLLVILLVAFLPVSTFYFGMKNDAFSDNFPNKYFFSQAFHSGFLPLWNPYLNFGFPIYADPGFAFWNPITWVFGALIKYSAYTLTLEVLLYIYIAGITMYRLGRYFGVTSVMATTVAAMYMCSGFFAGEIQHINFVTAAAFLPFLLQQFLSLFKNPNYRNAGLTAIAYYMVFACGHPAIPAGAIYFLATMSISLFVFNPGYRHNWKRVIRFQLLATLMFVVLFSPVIYSYVSVFSVYGRNAPVNQVYESDLNTGFSFTSYLSFIYPFATVKNASFLTDDLTMRNAYFSVAAFILFITQLVNKNFLIRSLLIAAFVMLMLGFGSSFKVLWYPHLPLLQYIRTNGEFRVFSIFCFCIIAGFGLQNITVKTLESYRISRIILKLLLIISLLLVVMHAQSVVKLYYIIRSFHLSAADIKSMLDSLTFSETFLIAILLNVVIILALLSAKANVKKISLIIIIDLIVNSIAYLPFSGTGTVTLSDIQKVYDKTPDGIVVPPLVRLKDIDTLPAVKTGLIGSLSYYNKQIGTTRLTDYPSYFTTTQKYFASTLPASVNNLPYVFLKKDTANYLEDDQYLTNHLSVVSFSPQKIIVEVNAQEPDSLVLLQNYYGFWKAREDGQEISITHSLITFMSVPLSKGKHTIEFYYEDNWLPFFVLISGIAFILIILFIIRSRKGLLPYK